MCFIFNIYLIYCYYGVILVINFTKMQGCGNDYIYIYDLEDIEENKLCTLVQKMSDRHFGIGADGVILISKGSNADFKMRMFNADGTEGAMCGNGIRCVGKYVKDKGLTNKKKIRIETMSGIKTLELNLSKNKVSSVKVNMGSPKFNLSETGTKPEILSVPTKQGFVKGYYLTLGNPHLVVVAESIKDINVEKLGKEIGESTLFKDKANVEFITIDSTSKISMRVWERGTGETLACGSGASAAVAALNSLGLVGKKVEVKVLGGSLKVSINRKDVFLEGEAKEVFEGVYYNV